MWCASHLYSRHSWMIGTHLVRGGRTENKNTPLRSESFITTLHLSGPSETLLTILNYYMWLRILWSGCQKGDGSTRLSELLYTVTPEFTKVMCHTIKTVPCCGSTMYMQLQELKLRQRECLVGHYITSHISSCDTCYWC